MQNGCARRAVAPSDNNITRGGVRVQQRAARMGYANGLAAAARAMADCDRTSISSGVMIIR